MCLLPFENIFFLSKVFALLWKQFSYCGMWSLHLKNNFPSIKRVRFSSKIIFFVLKVFAWLWKYLKYPMCSLHFGINYRTIKHLGFLWCRRKHHYRTFHFSSQSTPLLLPLWLRPLRIYFSDWAPSHSPPPTPPPPFASTPSDSAPPLILLLRRRPPCFYPSDSAPSTSTPQTPPHLILPHRLRPLCFYPSDSSPSDSPPPTPPPRFYFSDSASFNSPPPT
jgi:hypothetical protein